MYPHTHTHMNINSIHSNFFSFKHTNRNKSNIHHYPAITSSISQDIKHNFKPSHEQQRFSFSAINTKKYYILNDSVLVCLSNAVIKCTVLPSKVVD